MSSQQETHDDIVPVAVTLRNAFAAEQMNFKDMCRSQNSSRIDNYNESRRIECCNNHDNGKHPIECAYPVSNSHQDEANAREESRSLNESKGLAPSSELQSQFCIHIPLVRFSGHSHSEMHGNDTYTITHIPIEMQLVAPYALLVQLKHSYKNCEIMRNMTSTKLESK